MALGSREDERREEKGSPYYTQSCPLSQVLEGNPSSYYPSSISVSVFPRTSERRLQTQILRQVALNHSSCPMREYYRLQHGVECRTSKDRWECCCHSWSSLCLQTNRSHLGASKKISIDLLGVYIILDMLLTKSWRISNV